MNKDNNKIIPLTRDFMFASTFNDEENISVLEHFLSAYLTIPYDEIKGKVTLLSRHLPKEKRREASKEVDVLLKYGNEKIIIEMNAQEFREGKRDRNLVYASKVLSGEYKSGDMRFSDIGRVLQINFTTVSSYFSGLKLDRLINEFKLLEVHNPKVCYSDKIEIDVIDMGKVGNYNYIDERERVIGKWCKMITSNTLEALQKEAEWIMDDSTKEKLSKKVNELSHDDEMVKLESDYSMIELEMNTAIAEEKEKSYNEGIKQGIEQGEKQGEKRGRELGRDEGVALGIKQERTSMIKKLLASGIPKETIAKSLGIGIEEIDQITI